MIINPYQHAPPEFIMTWETTGAAETITIPLVSGESYVGNVDWGDGNDDDFNSSAISGLSHEYASANTYTVTILASSFPRIYFNNSGDRLKIKTIEQWGNIVYTNMSSAFFGCTNLDINAIDLPKTGTVTIFNSAFFNCTNISTFPQIDTSSGETFNDAFRGLTVTSFPWIDTSSATILNAAWRTCNGLTSFPLIDTSNATSVTFSWFGCTGLSSFPLLDLSSCTSVAGAWWGATGLTTFPNINMSNVDTFSAAWRGCTFTGFPVGFGSNMGAATDCVDMLLDMTLNTTDYNRLLVEIEAVNSNSSVDFHGGGSTHSGTGTTARTALVDDHTWTFTDGGPA